MTLSELNTTTILLNEGLIDSLILKIKNSKTEFKNGTTDKEKQDQVDIKMDKLLKIVEKDVNILRQKIDIHEIGKEVSNEFKNKVLNGVNTTIGNMRSVLYKKPEKILNMNNSYLEEIAYAIIQSNARRIAKKMDIKGIHEWASTNALVAFMSKFI